MENRACNITSVSGEAAVMMYSEQSVSEWHECSTIESNNRTSQTSSVEKSYGVQSHFVTGLAIAWKTETAPRYLTVRSRLHGMFFYSGTTESLKSASRYRALRGSLPCKILPAQHFVCHIVAKHSNMALNVHDHSTSAGASVIQWEVTAATNDNWSFQPTSDGFYHVISENSGMALNVDGISMEEGASIIQWPVTSDANDEWCFVHQDDGSYEIVNGHSGLVLEVQNRSMDPGASIQQGHDAMADHQRWFIEEVPSNDVSAPQDCVAFPPSTLHYVRSKHSNKALTVKGEEILRGVSIVQGLDSTDANESWYFVSSQEGYLKVVSQFSGMALSVSGASFADGANVIEWPLTPGATDDWCFELCSDGSYRIQNRQSRLVLEVENGSMELGANVQQGKDEQLDYQRWYVDVLPISDLATSSASQVPLDKHWQSPVSTPVIAAAIANLPNGNIVVWAAAIKDNFAMWSDSTWTAMYDPDEAKWTERNVDTDHDMFCPGTAMLSDGRLMIAGGRSSTATTFYNFANDEWTMGPPLVVPRGYNSMSVLGSGDVFTIGGSWVHLRRGNKNGELYTEGSGWKETPGIPDDPFLTNDAAGVYRSDNHAWLFTAPSGELFHAGPSKTTHMIDTTTSSSGSYRTTVVRDDRDAMNGNAVLYDVGKILVVGGSENYDNGPGSNRAFVLDLNSATNDPTSRRVGNLNIGRALINSVLLPTGEVVVIGGQTDVALFKDTNSVLHAELWNPETEEFTLLSEMQIPRNYHSAAILMKDGRIMTAGGGLCGGCEGNHMDMQIFTPPYLFHAADGSPVVDRRPVIEAYSRTVKAGETFRVDLDTSQPSHTFALVRISAATHSVNNDQRRIPLPIVNQFGRTFLLSVHSNRNVALTGYYYLFAMDENGVPSEAVDLRIVV